MKDSRDIRPKFKQNSIFLFTDDGVLFPNDGAPFRIKGKAASRWISRLSPYMDGEHTLSELCEGSDPTLQATVMKLISTLLEKGVLKNKLPEPANLLPDAVRDHFRSQIEFIDHYTDSPQQKFKNFRESRLLLVGSGESFTSLALALLHNGLQELLLAPTDNSNEYFTVLKAEVEKLCQYGIETFISTADFRSLCAPEGLGKYTSVAYCSENGSLKEIFDLHQRCITANKVFVPAFVFSQHAFIGPLVQPLNGPCWLCAQMRFSAHRSPKQSATLWRALFADDGLYNELPVSSPVARSIGNGLGFELFKLLSGALISEIENGVILQDVETLEATYGKLIKHPFCPVCSRLVSSNTIQYLEELVAGKWDHTFTSEELLKREELLLDPILGIFSEFRDEDLVQLPLRQTKLLIGSPTALISDPLDVGAYSIENLQEARHKAYIEAIRKYSQALPNKKNMIVASRRELEKQGKVTIPAQAFSIWSGSRTYTSDARIEWIPAFSIFKQCICYVPAAAIYTSSSFNQLSMFERTSAGSAAALTFDEVLLTGMLSAVGYQHVLDLIREHTTVVRLNIEELLLDDTDLLFLLKSVQHLKRPFVCLEIVAKSPVHVLFLYDIDTNSKLFFTVGIGLSYVDAAKKALLEFVGATQAHQFDTTLSGFLTDMHGQYIVQCGHGQTKQSFNRFQEPAATATSVEEYLKENHYDILFTDTTPSDIRETLSFISGKVLLARSTDA